MKSLGLLPIIITLAGIGPGTAIGQSAPDIFKSARAIKWGVAPPVVPKGAQAAVLAGDPFKNGSEYTLRLKMPDGYKIPPHWHPTDENVTVLSGKLGAGMGDKFNPASGEIINRGGFVRIPRTVHHFAWAEGATTIQVSGLGPFAFHYLNPAEDPRNQH
jgi:quercetin dioxygenase-like cupin family protein